LLNSRYCLVLELLLPEVPELPELWLEPEPVPPLLLFVLLDELGLPVPTEPLPLDELPLDDGLWLELGDE